MVGYVSCSRSQGFTIFTGAPTEPETYRLLRDFNRDHYRHSLQYQDEYGTRSNKGINLVYYYDSAYT